jgi:hypothetical protein
VCSQLLFQPTRNAASKKLGDFLAQVAVLFGASSVSAPALDFSLDVSSVFSARHLFLSLTSDVADQQSLFENRLFGDLSQIFLQCSRQIFLL